MQVSCQPVCQKIEPTIFCPPPVVNMSALPSAFPPLTSEELDQEWAKELLIGDTFAKEWDFYRAITCYKRGLILLPTNETERQQQLEYNLILCYYLGYKYQEALNIFEESTLSQASIEFPAFKNLVLIVYDCYLQTKQEDKASCVLELIRTYSPETTEDLELYQTIKSGDLDAARCRICQHREFEGMIGDLVLYDSHAKSPRLARTLNAFLPGAGYFYVGQKKSALTSFLINALFAAASYQFFRNGYPAAGAITASMEMGWYIGGINGAGIEAQEFNTRLYEGVGTKILVEKECFPVLMFETTF